MRLLFNSIRDKVLLGFVAAEATKGIDWRFKQIFCTGMIARHTNIDLKLRFRIYSILFRRGASFYLKQ